MLHAAPNIDATQWSICFQIANVGGGSGIRFPGSYRVERSPAEVRSAASEGQRAVAVPSGSIIERLTPREREVADLLVEGLSTKVIAYRLSISPRTVDLHRARIMKKLGARNVAQVVRTMLSA